MGQDLVLPDFWKPSMNQLLLGYRLGWVPEFWPSQENPAMQPLLPRGDLGDQRAASNHASTEVLGVFLLLRQGRIGDGQWLSSTNSDIWGSCGFPSWLLSGLLPWPWFSEHPPRTSGLVLDIFFWGPIWQNRAATGVSCDFWALAWAMPLHEGLFNAAFTLHQHGCLQWIHTPLVGLVGLVGDQGRCLASRLSPFWVSPSWSTRVYWSGLWSGGKLNNKHMFYVCFLVWVYICIITVYIYRCTHINTHLLNWSIKLTNTFGYGIKQLVPFGVISPGNS